MTCHVTYQELAELAAGELDAERTRQLQEHADSCAACRRRLDALAEVDRALAALPRFAPSAGGLLKARRSLSETVRRPHQPELLTLDEVAELLRISLDELEEVVLELPAFEVAGQLRVRRSKLLDWIEARERAFTRSIAQSEVARILADVP